MHAIAEVPVFLVHLLVSCVSEEPGTHQQTHHALTSQQDRRDENHPGLVPYGDAPSMD